MTETRLWGKDKLANPSLQLDLGGPNSAVRALSPSLISGFFLAGWFYFFPAVAWQLYTYVLQFMIPKKETLSLSQNPYIKNQESLLGPVWLHALTSGGGQADEAP